MSQADFFDAPQTTACYPNRRRDKVRVERLWGLAEQGNDRTQFETSQGTLFAKGYQRIVYGDHGPYVEFLPSQVVCPLRPHFSTTVPAAAYYEWLEPTDGSRVKVYAQRRTVADLPNPPAGGFKGNRQEGYADYVPGMIYVAPGELRVRPGESPRSVLGATKNPPLADRSHR